MITFSKQRWLGWTIFIALTLWILELYWRHEAAMPGLVYLSGWALLAVMLVLTLYNGRKKIPFLPLFTSEGWLQFHIYAGMLTGVLFLIHIDFHIPTGWFQGTLAWLYLLVMFSGFYGLFLSRTIPTRLTTRGGEVLFERIPAIRRRLQERAEAIALKSIPDARSTTVADFYVRELKDFFDDARNGWQHLFEMRTQVNRLLNKIGDLNRYLNAQERATMDEMAALVREKDGLDYHYSLQRALKLWLFAHIPLTYGLLLFTFAHIILVFAYSGGAR